MVDEFEANALACEVCCGDHDPAIHAATISIHAWMRERVKLAMTPFELPKVARRGEAMPKQPRDIRPDRAEEPPRKYTPSARSKKVSGRR